MGFQQSSAPGFLLTRSPPPLPDPPPVPPELGGGQHVRNGKMTEPVTRAVSCVPSPEAEEDQLFPGKVRGFFTQLSLMAYSNGGMFTAKADSPRLLSLHRF